MEYLGAERESEVEYEISRSRFVARIAPAEGVDAGLEYVAAVKRAYPDATHHPYAVTGSPESASVLMILRFGLASLFTTS